MALLSPQLQRFLLTKLHHCNKSNNSKTSLTRRARTLCCSAIAIDAPSSSLTGVSGIRWGSTSLKGARDEMEDDLVIRSDGLEGFSFAAVFDGHAGFSSVEFLRDELHKECVAALQGGLLLVGKDFAAIRKALQEAFKNVDNKLLEWLEINGEEDESGSTATVMLLGNDTLVISHIGDSCVVLSRSGKAEVLTDSHRPYGSSNVSLQEIRRIREAGGWGPIVYFTRGRKTESKYCAKGFWNLVYVLFQTMIVNGRICGDIAVSRAFGDIRFKTKKNEMLKKGVKEGRWSEKFCSRIQFKGDLVVASPDVFQISLGSDAEFLLLASDGLWDYIDSSDAVSFVRDQLQQHGDVQLACEALARAALDRHSQDNISILIADLGQTDWQDFDLPEQNLVYELGQAFATIGIVLLGIWISSQLSL